MADLGNLFFNMHLKDMTDDDFNKMLENIQRKLKSNGVSVKVIADTSKTLKDMKEKLGKHTMKIDMTPSIVSKAAIEADKTILQKSIKEALKDNIFKAKVEIESDNANFRKAMQNAFTNKKTTASDVRAQRVLEIQQRMADGNALALQRLKNARNKDARAAERHSNYMDRNNKSIGIQFRLLKQLKEQILDVYSIYTLERFLQSVVEIGGEFQKQRIALRAMLNDAAKADVLFTQVKELAIESPFNFRDLMGFTKQIAAFSIPYEEMHETTKRLADISAGLGVDMGRIILAYGQVRSASVLRGQELRQFTEAGIPLVDELAKKFTELEGKVVSAGEVFDKISKREVSFEMVKDILWQLTNEGGKFFNMQETLTESLSGKLAKLKDAWEIMLGSIAEGNNSTLSYLLDTVTNLTEKWEDIWVVLQSLIACFGLYKTTILLCIPVKAALIAIEAKSTGVTIANTIALHKNSKAMTLCERGAIRLLKAITSLSLIGKAGFAGLIIGALSGIALYIYNITVETDKLKEKLDEIKDATQKEINGAVSGYKLLVNKLHKVKEAYGDAAEQTKEYADIVSQINSSYGQYLGNLFSEAEAYNTIEESVKRVSAAIEEKKRNEQYQKSMNVIDEEYSSLLGDTKNDLEKKISSLYGLNKSDAKKFAQEIITLVENNKSIDDATKAVADMFNKPYIVSNYGKVNVLWSEIYKYFNFIKDRDLAYEKVLSDMQSKPLQRYINEIDDSFKDKFNEAGLDEKKKRALDIEKKEAYLALYKEKGLGNSDYAKQLEIEIATLKKWGESWVAITEEVRDKVYADNKRNSKGKLVENFLSTILPTKEDVEKGMLSSYLDKLAKSWEQINEELDTITSRNNEAYTESDRTEIARLKDQKQYIEEFLKTLGLNPNVLKKRNGKGNGNGNGKDQYLEDLKERLRLIKSAHSEYKKWTDIIGHVEAAKKVKNSGLFDMLFAGNEPMNLDDYTGAVEKIRLKLADYIRKGSNKNRREAYAEATRIIIGIEYDENKDELERAIKIANDTVQDSIEKWNIFKTVREKTNNEGLARFLAYSEFNVNENELMNQIRKKAQESLVGKEETFDGLLFYDEKTLIEEGYAALVPYVKSYKEAHADLKKSAIETLLTIVEKNRDAAEKIKEIERKKNKDIENINKNKSELEAQGINVDKIIEERNRVAENEVFKINFEEFKKTSEWTKIFDDLGRVSDSTLDSMLKKLEEFVKLVPEGAEEIKTIIDAFRKLREENISRKPLKSLFKSLDELREINSKIKVLERIYKENKTEQNNTNLKKSQDDKKAKQTDATKALHEGVKEMREYINAGEQLIGIMEKIGVKTPEWLSGYIANLGEMMSGLEHIDITKPMSIVTGTLQFAKGVIGSITSLGGLIDWNGSNAKDVISEQNKLIESNKHLAVAIDDLRESMTKTSGTKAIEEAKQAKAYQEQYNKNLLDIAWSQARYHNSHSSWSKKWKGFNQEQIERFSKKIGKDWNGDIFSLTPEQMKMLRGEVDMWKQIQDTGEGGYGKRLTDKLDAYIEQAGKIEDIERQLAESLTKISFDSLRSEFIDSLMDMDKSAQDFANDFERYMMRAVLNAKISNLLEEDLKKFYDKWAKYSKSEKELSDNERDDLKKDWNNIVDKGLAIRNEVAQFTGYKGDEKDSGGLSKGIKGVTEQTADLLASYINAIRADVSFKRSLLEKFVNSEVPKLSTIAQSQLTQLNVIAANTKRNAELVEDIYNILRRNILGANKFNI